MDQINVKRVNKSQPTGPVQSVQSIKRPRKAHKGLVAVIVVLVLVVLGGCFFYKAKMARNQHFAGDIKKDQYQGVFLSNGQVYFGKISGSTGKALKLTDIYYLQVQTPQPLPSKKDESSNQQQNLSLAKLGGELHGPEDSMYIETNQVLFWENLKNDSQVVKAIQQNKNK